MESRWNEWNIEHIGKHGVRPEEAEFVASKASRPYPKAREDDKWLVVGWGWSDRWLQVIFIFDSEDVVFVIHARPLTDREKRRERRSIR